AYSRSTLSVTSDSTYSISIGLGSSNASPGGDSWFGSAAVLLAKGGESAPGNAITAGAGGLASQSIGTTKFNGGNGFAGVNGGDGGGGGSSAGTAANGSNASSATGATAPAGGGNGGNGRTNALGNGAGSAGSVPGGGGGGVVSGSGNNGSQTGGAGANGRVVVSYTPVPYLFANDSTICSGQSATLTASGGGTYLWSNGSTASSITVSPTQTTTYSVTITNGCAVTKSLTINILPGSIPTPTISGTTSGCGSVTLTASGGTTYEWSGGSSTNTAINSFISTGTYTVTVTNAAGCSATASQAVTVTPGGATVFSSTTDDEICSGQSTTLNATGYVNSLAADFSFAASSGTFTPITGGTSAGINGDDVKSGAIPIGFNFNHF
ncbi:MAG: hypothetical protein ACKO9S_07565, partial [Bacteroidota bacterium]